MNLLRMIALAVLVALTAGAAAAPSPPRPDYYVMRHLHKITVGEDPGLNNVGKVYARRLAGQLTRFPNVRRPTAIYVSRTKRAQETAGPLAQRFNIQLKLYEAMDIDGLIARVKLEPGPVLIVGHSNTVPEIVERLGGVRPAAIPENRFGDIWRVSGPALRDTGSIRMPGA